MAKQVQLKAKMRTEVGRGPLKKLRATGVIPGSVYGPHVKPLNIAIGEDELDKALAHATGENVLVGLTLEGDKASRLALIQEVQHHPVEDTILHVDFREVSATEKMRTSVPVRPVGEPAGVKTGGGVLEFILRNLHVECLPQDLPDVIEVNVEALEIGQSIHVENVVAPKGVTLLDPKGQPVFIVAAPITEEEAAAAETVGGEAAEPEVIGAKPVEGEEGEAAPAAGKEAKPAAGAAPAKGAEAKPAAGAKPAAAAPAKPAAKK